MTNDRDGDVPSTDRDEAAPPADRESPVGSPVIRGDRALFGARAEEAVEFDPDDPDSVAEAARIVRAFAENEAGAEDNVYMLRGAAACAALVRGVGSYKEATERAAAAEPDDPESDGDASGPSVSFIRKWARVHDLPYSIRKHVAVGHIAPTAAKHVARVDGDARFYLAWVLLDHDLTVREIRALASEINDGTPVEMALRAHGITLGELTLKLPPETYLELRRRAALEDRSPGDLVAEVLDARIE